eukprot:TRINITY_DN6787_c0_g1_i2.p1 TRINITY_DN6787_c0_g1~~TRINITY_DN6787_c0_g1_i2.p1  ORF type:complete len:345 (+),score=52.82 TRINITY_DN6787_c0_g1_i2:799-1833(+)
MPGKKAPPIPPKKKIQSLICASGAPAEATPSKWELHGDVGLVKIDSAFSKYKQLIGEAMSKALNLRLVIEDKGSIVGELRKPEDSLILWRRDAPFDDETIATHLENGIKFQFDTTKIMFSSGNTTERVHMGVVCSKTDIVVDMFAGIGYFTLPAAVHGGSTVYAIEKNPDSVKFLTKNASLNKVTDKITIIHGDNRVVGDHLRGTASRVSMGFFDAKEDAKPFIPRAFSFLKGCDNPHGPSGIIHYHYLSTKAEAFTLPARHFREMGIPCLAYVPQGESKNLPSPSMIHLRFWVRSRPPASIRRSFQGRVVDVRKVKSFKPQIYHYVADVIFEPTFSLGPKEDA